MNSKKVLITGGNAGIGFETSKALALKGYRVIILGRTKQKCEDAVYQINQIAQNDYCTYYLCDLSNQNEIKKTAQLISEQHHSLDILINNAGQVFTEYNESVDGIEMQFATNHLAYFLLTYELIPLLQKSTEARIINVSSNSHYRGKVDFNNLYFKNNYKFFDAYAQSKLCNVLFTYALAEKLKNSNITVNALHPGLVKTSIGTKNTKWWESLAWTLWSKLGISVADGAKTSNYLASSDEVKNTTGKYWNKCKAQESLKTSYDKDIQEKLWKLSEDLCKIDYSKYI
jgi:NAD(P)-dependent dehydrogenase (short-subunit alcohol dehydrogenase family)